MRRRACGFEEAGKLDHENLAGVEPVFANGLGGRREAVVKPSSLVFKSLETTQFAVGVDWRISGPGWRLQKLRSGACAACKTDPRAGGKMRSPSN
jgi:hypothetical protein